jgi:hypothetical protein
MIEITLRGGPFDGQRMAALPPLTLEIHVMLDPPPIDQFNYHPLPGMPPCLPSKRYTYRRIGETTDYASSLISRRQSVVDFIRSIGLELLPWQENLTWELFDHE